MDVNSAFEDFRKQVDADPKQVAEARRRRDLFRTALGQYDDIPEIVPSGSLARGTQKDPIHDVDLIAIYDESTHPNWGVSGESAHDALNVTSTRVNEKLGKTNGTVEHAVWRADPRNHAVKCFLDDPNAEDKFTVDVMPAFRRNDMLLIPQTATGTWVPTNPEYLIAEVARRHREWNKFASTVRMLKFWGKNQAPTLEIKSLAIETLALAHLPAANNRPTAIEQFFLAAAWHLDNSGIIEDPAKVCGEIQPDLDYDQLAILLRTAGNTAAKAQQSVLRNDQHGAITLWREVFGPRFPAPVGLNPAPAAIVAPRPVKDTPQG
ncbi:nucleotidyltransferase [Cellulomonas sp. P24]|uniref:nucleotidyltransferase n=1 Tax=Cellulomonas sp. P24 TaxID=2885206 RepID=UPI00216AD09D|nr:nucleotidyltransferase [Cellulomonas sp. P24]MCR6491130.1 hypothetical protein [Cellulomonas sp. P24]